MAVGLVRIRTRYKLFKAIIAVAVIVFLATLYDMFFNDSAWRDGLLIGYVALGVVALLLYIGHKPDLDEPVAVALPAVEPEPEPVPAIVEPPPPVEPPPIETPIFAEPEPVAMIEEVPRSQRVVGAVDVQGPHNFRCPFCVSTFALEATHINRRSDFRMDCPYCGRSIRIPRDPRIAKGEPVHVEEAAPQDRGLYTCSTCGEVLRFTAPHKPDDRRYGVRTCPNCESPQVQAAIPS